MNSFAFRHLRQRYARLSSPSTDSLHRLPYLSAVAPIGLPVPLQLLQVSVEVSIRDYQKSLQAGGCG